MEIGNRDEIGEKLVYTGERCLSGECALCNPEHPDHAKAQKEQDHMFGVTHHGIDSECPVCNDKHPKHAQAMEQLRALSEGGSTLVKVDVKAGSRPARRDPSETGGPAAADSQGLGGGGVRPDWSALEREEVRRRMRGGVGHCDECSAAQRAGPSDDAWLLAEALEKYGRHAPRCYEGTCVCGLSAILLETRKARSEGESL